MYNMPFYVFRLQESDAVKRVVWLLEAAVKWKGEHHAHPHQH